MTKRDAKAHKVEWNKAISEGRVVRYNDGLSFRSYLTATEANDMVARFKAAGWQANIVKTEVK